VVALVVAVVVVGVVEGVVVVVGVDVTVLTKHSVSLCPSSLLSVNSPSGHATHTPA
jgi:hypothetical protein